MDTIDCPKCGQEHEPTGCHETDSGEWECETCGFKFNVLVEYTVDYSASCVEHRFSELKQHRMDNGQIATANWCEFCGAVDHETLTFSPEN